MLIEKTEQMAYEIADGIDEAKACLEDIKERWNRGEEIRESLIDVAIKNLNQAHHQAKTIEIAMKNLNKYLKTVEEVLNDANY